MNKISIYVGFLVLAISLYVTSVAFAQDQGDCISPIRAIDCELRVAFDNDEKGKFERLLIEGADPTVRFENYRNGWVFCAATHEGREEYLKLIIDKGFDVNFRQARMHVSKSLPLTCAVLFGSLSAAKLLVAAGADPATRMCAACDNKMDSSVLGKAAIVNEYNIAIFLLNKGNYSNGQIQHVVRGLEMFPVDESNPRNDLRLELADRIRAMGYEVNPWTKDKDSD